MILTPIVDIILLIVHIPLYYFYLITFKKLYLKNWVTVPQEQLNEENEQDMNAANLLNLSVNHLMTSILLIVQPQAHQRKLTKHKNSV
jgi:hypothetical protein